MNQGRYKRPLQEIYDPTGAFGTEKDPVSPVAEITKLRGIDWRIYWYWGMREAGVLEMDFITRTPEATPLLPDRSQIGEIFGSVCHHVECVPEFVCTGSGWRYWVLRLTPEELAVQALLLGPRPKCGCDSWLNARTSTEVYESLREWLQGLNQRA